jgi:hypothetical protein
MYGPGEDNRKFLFPSYVKETTNIDETTFIWADETNQIGVSLKNGNVGCIKFVKNVKPANKSDQGVDIANKNKEKNTDREDILTTKEGDAESDSRCSDVYDVFKFPIELPHSVKVQKKKNI